MDWYTKAYALLHDPPYKALWPLGVRPYRGADHEQEAVNLFTALLQGTKLGGGAPDQATRGRVAAADRLAASFDRWALPPEGGRYWVRPRELQNPFNPRLKLEINTPEPPGGGLEAGIEEAFRELRGVLSRAGDEREAYFALYAALELAWIRAGLPPLPADTRMPTHTIFDHLYATASALNWVGPGGGVRGCLLQIDVPGIQRLISSSRKAGDYRAGSMLVSLAVWLTAWQYMEELGPDVLLSPTPRLNPLFYMQLRRSLPNVGGKIYGLFSDAVKSLLGQDVPGDFLVTIPTAVVPGTALLAVPDEKYAELAEERFLNALDWIREAALGRDVQKIPIDLRQLDDDVRRVAEAALGVMPRRYLPLRVRWVCADEALKAAEEAARRLGTDRERLLFYGFIKALLGKPALPKPVSWFEKGGRPRFAKLYDGPWLHSTLDPDQPAAVKFGGVFRGGLLDYDDETKAWLRNIGVKDIEKLKKTFKPKEALGPVDVLKRALYYRSRNKVESVEAVALRWYIEHGVLKQCGLPDDVVKKLEDIASGDGDADVLFGTSEEADRALAQCRAEDVPPPSLMYAIVRADGDDVGKLIRGCVAAPPEPPPAELAEGDRGAYEEARRRAIELIQRAQGLERCDGGAYVVPTPAYYAALSAAMMAAALKDAFTVFKHKGELVFAGGDDLLAFSARPAAFKIVRESRSSYWGEGGFHRLGNYAIPAAAAYGKSFSVRLAHAVTDFMALEVEKAAELLEEAKSAVDGKDALAVSTSTGHAGFLKLNPADPAREAEALADALRTRALSRNLPYDLDRIADMWLRDPALARAEGAAHEEAARLLAQRAVHNNARDGAADAAIALLDVPLRDKTPLARLKNMSEVLKALREWT